MVQSGKTDKKSREQNFLKPHDFLKFTVCDLQKFLKL